MKKRGNLLIVHATAPNHFDKITNVTQLLKGFEQHSHFNCFYYDASFRSDKYNPVDYDGILFVHFIHRLSKEDKKKILKNISWVKKCKCPKALFPQDEYVFTSNIITFCKEFGITHLFTLAAKDQWRKLYGNLCDKIEFNRVMPGYLENNFIKRMQNKADKNRKRTIDVGYRTHPNAASIGRHNWAKTRIADVFIERLKNTGFSYDISYDRKDTFIGESWYDFLFNCRYTLGVEGGASILDKTGILLSKTSLEDKRNKNLTKEELEHRYFPGRDGEINYVAISPRHLEAASTKTCQILMEGDYNGKLVPWKHYIPLKKDYSNLDDIIKLMEDEDKRIQMVERAYQDVALSKYNSLNYLVYYVLKKMRIKKGKERRFDYFYLSINNMIEQTVFQYYYFVNKIVKKNSKSE